MPRQQLRERARALPSDFRAVSQGRRCRGRRGPQERARGRALSLVGCAIFPSPACHRVQRHPFERIATPFQVYSWTAPQAEHAMDCVRAEDAYTSRLGYEEHIPGQVPAAWPCPRWAPLPSWVLGWFHALPGSPMLDSSFASLGLFSGRWKEGLPRAGHRAQAEPVSPSLIALQTRDWNEELQTTRELPRKNLPERLLRERAIFKVPAASADRQSQAHRLSADGFSCGQEESKGARGSPNPVRFPKGQSGCPAGSASRLPPSRPSQYLFLVSLRL